MIYILKIQRCGGYMKEKQGQELTHNAMEITVYKSVEMATCHPTNN